MVLCDEEKPNVENSKVENGSFLENVDIYRKTVECSDLTKDLFSNTDNNLRQFACIYAARLKELSQSLQQRAQEKWEGAKIVPLADLESLKGERCVLIGTLFKHQQWKPSILREMCEEDQLLLSENRPDYCSEDDQLFLEDETSRIRLVGDSIGLESIVTGVVSAILGRENDNSTFQVEDWCFPGTVAKAEKKLITKGKLVLLSGLNMSSNSNKLPIILLSDWLSGLSGNANAQKADASIVQVIVAGNSIKSVSGVRTNKDLTNFTSGSSNYHEVVDGLQKLDAFVSAIVENCCLSLMPGDDDVSSLLMPQRQLHPCLFPKSRRYETFTRATNPWICKIGSRIVAGSSGQPIEDIVKCCGKTKSWLEYLEKTLEWRHFCPTCPDTLPVYPSGQNVDPMIIRENLDIYFAGNAEKFETKLLKNEKGDACRLICVPDFSLTQTAVVVDLESLDVETISFGVE